MGGEKGGYGRSWGKENHSQNILYFQFISFSVKKKTRKKSVVTTTYLITEHFYIVQTVATPF